MGQSYSISITYKTMDETLFKQLCTNYFYNNGIKNLINASVQDYIDEIFGVDNEIKNNLITASLQASYGYHDTMLEWFEAVHWAFDESVELWIYPDEGASNTVRVYGDIVTHWYDDDELEEMNNNKED